MKIGQRIKELRKLAKITTKPELAEKIGVHETTIRRWERNIDKEPGIEIAEKIAAALGTTVGILMGENDPEAASPEVPQRNLPISDSVSENKISNDDLGLGYWGTIADNARKIAARGNEEEIALITPLLRSALKSLMGEALTVEKSARQIIDVQAGINNENNMNVGKS